MTHPRDDLINVLAEFLCSDEARHSVEMEIGRPDAKYWGKLRDLGKIRGWGAKKADAVDRLKEVLYAEVKE